MRGRTLSGAIDHYLATVSVHKRGTEWEARRFAAMLVIFGDVPLTAITTETMGQWRDIRLKTVSGSTVQRETNLLRSLFTVAREEWRWIDHNPFRGVRMPKANEPRHQLWGWRLIRRVLRADRGGKTAETIRAFHIALHTGLRLAEVLSGIWIPARRVIELERTKTGGRVAVPTTRRAAKVLGGPSFTVDANEASVLFSKLCRELLIDGLTFHDTRGSALTWMSRRMDILTLARISRHKDLKILMNTYFRETADSISQRI
jgi:integrase